MATNSRHKMMDDAFRQWVRDLEDGELLREWAELLKERIAYVDRVGAMTFDELVDGFRRCARGETLYLGKRLRIAGNLYAEVKFLWFRPGKWPKPATLAVRHSDLPAATTLDREQIMFYQPARVDLATRRRAAIIKHERRLKG